MLLAQVDAAVNVSPAGEMVQIEARVSAESPRPLTWRLTVDTAGPGGTSRSVQSGATTGSAPAPVSVVRINANALGEARLEVRDGETVIAEDVAALGPAGS